MAAGDYSEETIRTEIPKGVGVEGFLKLIRNILTLPRVQTVEIHKDSVTYTRIAREGETFGINVAFDELMPAAIVRNVKLVEHVGSWKSAAVALGELLERATDDQLHPLGFVLGANSAVWSWLGRTTSIDARQKDYLFGIPAVCDRQIEDDTVVLCAGYLRGGTLVDTQKAYKIAVPRTK